jgi:hypothetical protein
MSYCSDSQPGCRLEVPRVLSSTKFTALLQYVNTKSAVARHFYTDKGTGKIFKAYIISWTKQGWKTML